MASATLDATGVRFAEVGDRVLHWNGIAPASQLGAPLGSGSTPEAHTVACWSIGMTTSGDEWTVRATKDAERGAIMLRIRNANDPGVDRMLSAPGATAVMPAATLDARGRLHVIWYDTAGAQGRLLYRHSMTNDLAGDFTPEVVLDDNAAPGNRWYPGVDSAAGLRRLREYIDIVADGDRVHVVWTHAPVAPSRVHTRYIDAP
jgi:hypothetical protein